MIACPSCRGEDIIVVKTDCLSIEGYPRSFSVCANCDYGINNHTEGLCDCPKVASQ